LGVRRRVVGSASIPGNWQNFLRVDSNKKELFKFLSEVIATSLFNQDKELIITHDEKVLTHPPQESIDLLAPCTHEEADTRMMLHVAHASQNGHSKIMIRTVDTDVVVLAVSVANTLPEQSELWLAFGTGKHFRYLAAHEITTLLGPEKASALPMFHALTGCDTVSAFVGHGKRTAWAIWKSLPELTNALLQLSCAPNDIHSEIMDNIQRFVILMYDRTSTCTEVNTARRKIFAKKHSVERIPPTFAALIQHVRRTAYQGGHVWGQSLLPRPLLPSPIEWG